MNKKQKNRKSIQQIQRNRLINKRYITTIRNFTKKLQANFHLVNQKLQTQVQEESLQAIQRILPSFLSILDKAVKKKILHQKNASRKKSRMMKRLFLLTKK
jgi:ribosomal protein S20